MKISFFSNAYDNFPIAWEGNWQAFLAEILPHRFVPDDVDKEDCPAFSPAEYPEGARRGLKNVTQVHLAVFDGDHQTEESVFAVDDVIERLGIAGLIYTTWRHGEDPWRIRGVFPLSRPVLRDEWPLFWARFNTLFGGICDPQCKDASRLYFSPAAPEGSEEHHWWHLYEGVALDVEYVMGLDATDAPMTTASNQKLSRESLDNYAKWIASKRSDPYKSELGRLLRKVVQGEPFAEFGERDTTIFKLSQVLGERFWDYNAVSIAEHFAASLQLMNQGAPDAITVDDVASKIVRAQQAKLDEDYQKQQEENLRIKEAWGNCRQTPYTPDEISSFGPLDYRWVIQYGRSYYFFMNGTYKGPHMTEEMQNVAGIWLAPAKTAGISTRTITAQGQERPKNIGELVQQYGTVASAVTLDYQATKTVYDEARRTLIEAPCPMRPIEPRYHESVAIWLELMSGDQHQNLLTWLAASTSLDRPCAALFLTGKKGAGKSLLALGLSRIWTTDGPTTLDECFASFNDAMAKCPIVLADEKLPQDFRGFVKTAELREHIQATSRPFKRKFMPNARLLGATRTIIAANNEDVLQTRENLTVHDLEAIIDRYFHVPVDPISAEYLQTINTFEDGWVSKDVIAEHVMWLVENHPWTPQGRFLIPTDTNGGLMRGLMTRSGVRALICQWLVSYLLDPKTFHLKRLNSNMYVRVRNGQLLVNVRAFLNCWDAYMDKKREPPPNASILTAGLKGLYRSSERTRIVNSGPGNTKERVDYRIIDVEHLVQWAAENDFADREQIDEALAIDTEKLLTGGS